MILKLIMFAARTIIGNYCYKKSVKYILSQVNWLPSNTLIKWSGVKLIHKIINNKKPINIFKHFNINKRTCAKIYPTTFPKTKFAKDLYINKCLDMFNQFPADIKRSKPNIFKIKGLKYLKSNYSVP